MKADLTLVEEAQAGSSKAFSELVLRHQKALLRLCLRFTRDLAAAEEITQEAFVKAYEKLDGFEGRASFKSWLFQIGVNTAKNWLRSQRADTVSVDDVHMAVGPQAEAGMIQQDLKLTIQREVDRLPERQKVALTLRIYEDLSFQEIAQVMDCPYDTAKANFRHGLMKVKAAFEADPLLRTWLDDNVDMVLTNQLADGEVET